MKLLAKKRPTSRKNTARKWPVETQWLDDGKFYLTCSELYSKIYTTINVQFSSILNVPKRTESADEGAAAPSEQRGQI